jgi:tRNA(Leu) C34 or U34 (ribose-2'-O)-methylase TrmL
MGTRPSRESVRVLIATTNESTYRELTGNRLALETERDLTSLDKVAILPAQDDSPLWAWRRNVLPKFQGLTTEQIQAELKKTALPFRVAVDHATHDFNVGTVIRNANAFGAEAVFYLGIKHLDRRSCCGTHNYTTITHLKTIDELKAENAGYTFVGVENNHPDAKVIDDYEYPDKCLLLFGCEVGGLSKEVFAECKDIIYIQQRGSVPSLNLGTASGIVFNDFATKHKRKINVQNDAGSIHNRSNPATDE